MTTVAGHGDFSGAPESLTYWILHYILHTLMHEQREPMHRAVPDEDADRAARFAAHMLLQAARCLAPGQVRTWPLAPFRESNHLLDYNCVPLSLFCFFSSPCLAQLAGHVLLQAARCLAGRERWEVENTRYVEQAACPILLGMVSSACG